MTIDETFTEKDRKKVMEDEVLYWYDILQNNAPWAISRETGYDMGYIMRALTNKFRK